MQLHFLLKSKRKPAKEVYLCKIAAGKITACNFNKKTPSQVAFTVMFFRIFQHTEVVVVNVKDKGMCSLKIHDNSNECQHDILYVRKNAIKLKKQTTRTMSTLFIFIANLFETFFCCNRKYPSLVPTSYFSGNFAVLFSVKKQFYKKGDHRNFTKFTGNTCARVSF